MRRIDEEREDGCCRDCLVQYLQPFRPYLHVECCHARDIAARSAKATDKSLCDWIGSGGENNWNCPRRCFSSQRRRVAAGGGNQGYLPANQIGRQFRQSIVLTIGRAILDSYILAIDAAGFAHAAAECGEEARGPLRRTDIEISDHRHGRLLRAHRNRPRRRAADQLDELPPLPIPFLPTPCRETPKRPPAHLI
jgi:hypothetical protein